MRTGKILQVEPNSCPDGGAGQISTNISFANKIWPGILQNKLHRSLHLTKINITRDWSNSRESGELDFENPQFAKNLEKKAKFLHS